MGGVIDLAAADGFAPHAYLAEPEGEPRGGIVILQEIFGVTDHMRRVADLYAGHGYRTLAPALFDRLERDCVISYDDIERARDTMMRLDPKTVLVDIAAAIEAARCGAGVATIGYCWGGTQSYLAAASLGIEAGVSYYGTRIAQNLDQVPTCPFLFHFGRDDHLVPMEDVEKIRARNPEGEIHVYEAGHGFNCDERPSFHAPSAELALSRTLEFLAKNLKG